MHRPQHQPRQGKASEAVLKNPAEEFFFAQVAKPGPRRKQMSSALIQTTRSIGQMRATLAGIALAASEIAATYERSLGVPFVSGLSSLRAG